MKLSIYGFVAGAALMAMLSTSLVKSDSKIAYVNSSKILTEYLGMKEATANYEKSLGKLQQELDKINTDSLTEEQLPKIQAYFNDKKVNLDKKKEIVLEGVYNQINEFVKNYADEKGYKLVVAPTQAGNILYAAKDIDITEEVITKINRKYLGNN